MRTYSQTAVHQAARVAHNPYRRNIPRGNLHAQIPVKEKIVKFIKKFINSAIRRVREKPLAGRTIRRAVKTVSGARNKDDPHLVGRV